MRVEEDTQIRKYRKREGGRRRLANQSHKAGPKAEIDKDLEWRFKLAGTPWSGIASKYSWIIPKFWIQLTQAGYTGRDYEARDWERYETSRWRFYTTEGLAFGSSLPRRGLSNRRLVILHEPWQVSNFGAPKALEGAVIKVVRKRFNCGTLDSYAEIPDFGRGGY